MATLHSHSIVLATSHLRGPHVDFAGFSPLIALLAGAVVVLMVGLLSSHRIRERAVPTLSLATLSAALGLTIWQWHAAHKSILSGALRIDHLALMLNLVLLAGGAFTVLLAWRPPATHQAPAHNTEGGVGEFHALLLTSIGGMSLLASAQNTVAVFIGLELLSIPLYVLCATGRSATGQHREHSLESGLKYLIVGSVGSATLLYGLALIYGATGATDFDAIASAISERGLGSDVLTLTGIALCVGGLCFKASVAPFHQWTPDVYEGAPTPVTAFMAVATKAAAFAVFLRFFDLALIGAQGSWAPALAVLATITILVGNVGALGQSSLKRMLAYSSVAQAGYMLAGVVVSSQLGIRATVFYLAVYVLMNMASFAVIVARERETGLGDNIQAVTGLGREQPWLAWPMTISMLALAGIPATAGFIGKFYLIDAAVSGGYAWLGVAIVVGSMISLGYYLPVIAAMWMRAAPEPATAATPGSASSPLTGSPAPAGALPAMAGGSPELDPHTGSGVTAGSGMTTGSGVTADSGVSEGNGVTAGNGVAAGSSVAATVTKAQPEVIFVAILAGAGTVFLGIVPQPLFDLVHGVGSGFGLF
jgi:NADH-quinone oxidoreductase subunit N